MKVVDRSGNIITKGESQNQLLKKLYGTFLGRCALKILVCRFVSQIGGWYMSSRLSKHRIAPFVKEYEINLDDYIGTYHSYNDFFTRKIKSGKRPIMDGLIAPADSKLTYYPINEDSIFHIKDTYYSLSDLLENKQLATQFEGGSCLVFRLCVDDYHRYSYIDDGIIGMNRYIPGEFHTVNPIANDYYPIYKTNSREYTIIQTKHLGTIIQMEVGAMMVGRIVNHQKDTCIKGEEKGYFEFGGSTIIVLISKDQVTIDKDIIENSSQNIETVVKLGEKIGTY